MTSLKSAQTALAAGSWDAARAAFRAVAEESGDPLAYEGWAQASWWRDDGEECVQARETAYRRHRILDDPLGAARAATALSWDTLLFGYGAPVARGWWGRAATLLATLDEAAEHGWHAVREAELAIAIDHDPGVARAAGERASAIANRLGLADLAIVGEALQGLAMTGAGDVAAGTVLLDSSVAAATSGDVPDPMWMGKICCWLIAACTLNNDVSRAADWCRRVETICVQRGLTPLFNVCRSQHASVQVACGSWHDAERELTAVLERLSTSRRVSRLEAVAQLGELRRRQGRFDEAEALFAQAEFHPLSIIGQARMQLARGDATNAWTAIRGLLHRLPAHGRMARAEVLPSAAVIATAAGEAEAAGAYVAELRQIAEFTGSRSLTAAASAAGALLVGPAEAVPMLTEAVQAFDAEGLRFDEAHTRLALAEALAATGDRSASRRHLSHALQVLSELSAGDDLARARRLVRALDLPGASPLTAREREVLTLVARGMSNAEIAAALVLSEHTVHRHVANILTKLGQTSRTGAATHGLHTGLI
ncbi:response regulator transcription factor [Ruania alba]|uniref:Regulatory protein, luxR family n=1 Tax=Ruania alba TaxID=648782 RepID=A0A1H5MKL4_9MICO|nr:helix-turn-helix transcriptional regulator [Ruania alba]SEE89925.1 regulatory protein, luxR family [Ruania alba]